MDELLSITEFSNKIGKSRQWVYQLIARGEVQVLRISGKPFIHRDYIDKIKKN